MSNLNWHFQHPRLYCGWIMLVLFWFTTSFIYVCDCIHFGSRGITLIQLIYPSFLVVHIIMVLMHAVSVIITLFWGDNDCHHFGSPAFNSIYVAMGNQQTENLFTKKKKKRLKFIYTWLAGPKTLDWLHQPTQAKRNKVKCQGYPEQLYMLYMRKFATFLNGTNSMWEYNFFCRLKTDGKSQI